MALKDSHIGKRIVGGGLVRMGAWKELVEGVQETLVFEDVRYSIQELIWVGALAKRHDGLKGQLKNVFKLLTILAIGMVGLTRCRI